MKKHIVHTADWHLRESHLGLTSRSKDFFLAAMSTIDITADIQQKTSEPACMVVPGDLLNSVRPSSAVIDQLRALNDYAIDLKVKIFTVIGNHDQTSPAWSNVLPKDEDYGFDDITGRSVVWNGLHIHGLPPVPSSALPALLAAIPGSRNIVLWHGSLKDFTGYPVETMLSVADLQLDHCQLFLLGDIHKTDYVTHACGCIVGYPGATEVVTRAEPLTHTCTHFAFDDNGVRLPESGQFLPVKHRLAMAFRIDTEADIAEVTAKILARQDEGPIVFLRYNPAAGPVSKILRQSIDSSKVILRDEEDSGTFSSSELSWALLNMQVEHAKSEDLTLTQLMVEVIGSANSILPLCQELTNPETNVAIAINNYVEKRMQEIV